uniref:Uncharacterized protein n=1 Tax=Setaria italica TaxID=4555 RepID=K3ZPP8_SETIT
MLVCDLLMYEWFKNKCNILLSPSTCWLCDALIYAMLISTITLVLV